MGNTSIVAWLLAPPPPPVPLLSKIDNTAWVQVERRKEGCGYFQFLYEGSKGTSYDWPTLRELCPPAGVRTIELRDVCCRVTFRTWLAGRWTSKSARPKMQLHSSGLGADRAVAIPRIHVIRIRALPQ
jgi:hypothetical protein